MEKVSERKDCDAIRFNNPDSFTVVALSNSLILLLERINSSHSVFKIFLNKLLGIWEKLNWQCIRGYHKANLRGSSVESDCRHKIIIFPTWRIFEKDFPLSENSFSLSRFSESVENWKCYFVNMHARWEFPSTCINIRLIKLFWEILDSYREIPLPIVRLKYVDRGTR